MRRIYMFSMGLAIAVTCSGCSITGSWRVVATDPPEAPFPMGVVTFDGARNYTATGPETDKRRTSTGQYRWNGFTLETREDGHLPHTYRASLGLNGRLVLTHEQGGARVSATLEKVQP